MADFFISYTKADRAWAEWIAWELEAAGFTTRFQAWDFRPGASFVAEMEKALRESDRTLAVLSPEYRASAFGSAEWRVAVAQDPTGDLGKLLLVQVRTTLLEGSWARPLDADLTDAGEEAARDRLLAGVRRPESLSGTVPSSQLPPGESRRPEFPGDQAPEVSPEAALQERPLPVPVQAAGGTRGVGCGKIIARAALLAGAAVLTFLLVLAGWWLQMWRSGGDWFNTTVPSDPAEENWISESKPPEPVDLVDPGSAPELETGMHRGRVWKVSVDAKGRLLATGSADGTVRLWDLSDGRLLRVLRPPADLDGMDGARGSRVVALSPDGEWLAVGGDLANGLALFATATGNLVRRMGKVRGDVENLVFSRDGKRIALSYRRIGLGILGDSGATGLLVLSALDGGTLWKEEDRLVFGLDFDAQGRLATAEFDGEIRLYDAGMQLLGTAQVDSGAFDLRFSPDGAEIAVGFAEIRPVTVLSGRQPLLSVLRTSGDRDIWASVAWSADGSALYAGHREWGWIRRWSGPEDEGHNFETSASILDLAALPDGRMVFASDTAGWGILDTTGKVDRNRGPEGIDFGQGPLLLSSGGTIAGFSAGGMDLWFTPEDMELGTGPPPEDLEPPRTSLSGREIRLDGNGWFLGNQYTSLGTSRGLLSPLVIPAGPSSEEARAVAQGRDGGIFLGTTWRLIRYDGAAKEVWGQGASSGIRAVNVSRDGRLVVAALRDGRLQWRRADTGDLLLTTYIHPDLRRWAVWSPSGLFEVSENAGDLLGWPVTVAEDVPAIWVPAGEVPDRRRPEVLTRLVRTLGKPGGGG